MVEAALALAAANTAALAGALVYLHRRRRDHATPVAVGWLDELEVETVLVQLIDGRSLAGYFAGARPDAILLRNARYVGPAATVDVAGELIIPRNRIDWIQRGVQLDDAAVERHVRVA